MCNEKRDRILHWVWDGAYWPVSLVVGYDTIINFAVRLKQLDGTKYCYGLFFYLFTPNSVIATRKSFQHIVCNEVFVATERS